MRLRNARLTRALALTLAAVLLTGCLPCAALADTRRAVTTTSTVVLQQPSLNSRYVWVPPGMDVSLLATNGNAAMVERNGIVGYMYLPHLMVETPAPSAPEQPSAQAPSAERAITVVNTAVFQQPSLSSRYVWVPSGYGVYVLATRGNAAMVTRDGVVGYMYLPHLLLESQYQSGTPLPPEPQPQPANPLLPPLAEAYASGNYSTEQICFLFLVEVMGYNAAAASGVIANIKYESSFNPQDVGDGGTSYGICQWHASRKTRLTNYCQQNGLDVTTLPAQLMYLKYELENFYPMVNRFLLGVSNTPEGAYQAGYYFCYNFEAPASRDSKSVTRGNYAQSTVYVKYAAV